MSTTAATEWKYLVPDPKGRLRQRFIKGTYFAAWDVYALAADDEEPRTREEVAAAFGIPVEAVDEAVAYCRSNPPELRQDFADQEAWFATRGLQDPDRNGPPPAPSS